jgi:hypothetical protein
MSKWKRYAFRFTMAAASMVSLAGTLGASVKWK